MAMTRKSIIAATAIALLAGRASAQTRDVVIQPYCVRKTPDGICVGWMCRPDIGQICAPAPTGIMPSVESPVPTDLDKAMAICVQRRQSITAPGYYPNGIPPEAMYPKGWEACVKIKSRFEDSAEARDLEFVKRIAEGK